ncbi:MAG: NshR/TsnR family 23S rRNA methyltransferase, partial [Myxococcales bacterium]|nr:NshR/TsnR family 23S rRNA methyltransferase [Myxococcales bacterium]
IVVLEGVSISGNVGAIVRTARALGAGGLVLLGDDPIDVYDRRLIRASRGHVFSLPVVACDTPALLGFCRQHGLGVLVTTPHADTPIERIATLPQRLAVVFGSEKRGCSAELLEAATLRVAIPMVPEVESLNVSAAAGIVLFLRAGSNRLAPG